LRFERGEMTQLQLAQAAGVTRQTIIAIESGRFAPSLELAFRISDVLGERLQDVFYREVELSVVPVAPLSKATVEGLATE
jgi:putative transcriptional regulator